MEATVLTAAIVLVAAAIIGGGLKAFNIEVPLLDSGVRQVALLGFGGFLFFLALVILPEDQEPPPTTTTSTTTAPETRGTTTTQGPMTTGRNNSTSTSRPETNGASGTGQVAHCATLTVFVGPVALEDNQLWVPIRLENPAGNDPIEIPPHDLVTLTDDEGTQYALATFAQLRNGKWPLSQRIASGATFDGRIIYERSGSGQVGRLLIADIRNANDPFETCSVNVDGFGLP